MPTNPKGVQHEGPAVHAQGGAHRQLMAEGVERLRSGVPSATSTSMQSREAIVRKADVEHLRQLKLEHREFDITVWPAHQCREISRTNKTAEQVVDVPKAICPSGKAKVTFSYDEVRLFCIKRAYHAVCNDKTEFVVDGEIKTEFESTGAPTFECVD